MGMTSSKAAKTTSLFVDIWGFMINTFSLGFFHYLVDFVYPVSVVIEEKNSESFLEPDPLDA